MATKTNTGGQMTFVYHKGHKNKLSYRERKEVEEAWEQARKRKLSERFKSLKKK